MSERVFILVHYNGQITNTGEGVTFCSENSVAVSVCSSISLLDLQNTILRKLGLLNRKQISQVVYRLPIAVAQNAVRYTTFLVGSDEDVSLMFYSHSQCPEIRIIELFITLEDTNISSGGSAPNPLSAGTDFSTRGSDPNSVAFLPSLPVPSPSPTFALYNPQQNEDVHRENAEDMGDDRSFRQLAMQIAEPLTRDGPIAGFESFVDCIDEEEEPIEVPADSDSGEGSDGEAAPITDNQPSITRPTMSQSQDHPRHYSYLNMDAMEQSTHTRPSGSVGGGDVFDNAGENELYIGQQFPNKEAVLFAVKNYSIRRSVEYKVLESDQLTYHGKCKHFGNGCTWSIRITYRRKKERWEIRKYNGPHTCLSTSLSQDHPKLDTNVICTIIFPMVQADPTISVKVLQGSVEARYGFKASYRKVWLAKQKVIAKVYGGWEESYNELPRWLQALQMFVPGTIIQLTTLPYYSGNFLDRSCVMFHRLFWTFQPCIEAFKYCKPFISIDGTHLYGKYGGTLLMAIAQDGNSNILPIAFAVVEGETRDAWSFFLMNLRQHVTPQEGILIISDRHGAIKAAINSEGSGWHPPMAYHAYCIRHIASNFALQFKNKDARRALVNAAYAKTHREFVYYYGLLRDENPAMCAWIDRIPKEKWTQYCDEGRRFGHMTTNLSECINAVLKGTRNLPITALVKSTYFRLVELFVRKGQEAEAQLVSGQVFSQALMRAIEINKQSIGTMNVSQFSRASESFVVEELAPTAGWSHRSYRVHLRERRCDCGYFQALHFPCPHVLAACAYARVDWATYVDDVYRIQIVFNVYRTEFAPVPSEDFWPEYHGHPIRPNPALRRAIEGRPVSTRIRNNMDEVEPGPPNRCGLCRQEGHTRRRCPTLHASSSSRPSTDS